MARTPLLTVVCLAALSLSGSAMAAFSDTAFQTGSGYSGSDVAYVIGGIVITVALVWVAWLSIGTYRAWADGSVTLYDMGMVFFRAILVLFILGWLMN